MNISRRKAVLLGLTLTFGGVVVAPVVASAHVPVIEVSCETGINVDLSKYSGTDHVTIWKDGNVIVDTDFIGSFSFHRGFTKTVSHTWRVKVAAGNERSPDVSGTVAACREIPSTTTVVPTTAVTTTTAAPTTTTAATTTTVAATTTSVASSTTVASPTTTVVSATTAPTTTIVATTVATTSSVPKTSVPLPATGTPAENSALIALGLLVLGGGSLFVVRRSRRAS